MDPRARGLEDEVEVVGVLFDAVDPVGADIDALLDGRLEPRRVLDRKVPTIRRRSIPSPRSSILCIRSVPMLPGPTIAASNDIHRGTKLSYI